MTSYEDARLLDRAKLVMAVARGLRLARPEREWWHAFEAWQHAVISVADHIAIELNWGIPDFDEFVALCGLTSAPPADKVKP
jgi:hypothetical protein